MKTNSTWCEPCFPFQSKTKCMWSDLKWQGVSEIYMKGFILVRRVLKTFFCYQADTWMTLAGSLLQHSSTKGIFFKHCNSTCFFQLRSYYYKVSQLKIIYHVLSRNKSSRTVLANTLHSFAGSYYSTSHNTNCWNGRRGLGTHFNISFLVLVNTIWLHERNSKGSINNISSKLYLRV